MLLVICPYFQGAPAGGQEFSAAAEQLPVAKAVAFLSDEVPRWPREHACYSCHNNGDAARALYVASASTFRVEAAALRETTQWLRSPQRWEEMRPDEQFSDKRLASLQFAFALATAAKTGHVNDRPSLLAAARIVASHQASDGSWSRPDSAPLGAPATYGTHLSTAVALSVLESAEAEEFAAAIHRGREWLVQQRPNRVLDAAASLWAAPRLAQERATPLRQHCLEVIRRGEAPQGGWGPFVNSAPEPFDTAIVLLALHPLRDEIPDAERMRQQGIGFLLRIQQEDGSWPETTRPPLGESYAQRLSTTGWATLALLECQTAQ